MPAPTLTVRPKAGFAPKLERLALEAGKSEALVLLECAEAVIEMIENEGGPTPLFIQRARILRKHLQLP